MAFSILGLSVSLRDVLNSGELWIGLALAGLLILIIRPVLVGLLLLAVKLDLGERAFVLWSGLKGAVPILLGMFIITSGTVQAPRVYAIIFIVVLVSVIVQGGLVPTVAAALALIHRFGLGSVGGLNTKCPSFGGEWGLSRVRFTQKEEHLVDASFPYPGGRVSFL